MLLNKAYYTFKFLVPRRLQILLRRYLVKRKQSRYTDVWPIDPNAAKPLGIWGHDAASCPHIPQWPDGKKFALVLTHDVESANGLDRCYKLAEIEERLGFRSSFGFVPGDYPVPEALRQSLTDRGFEIAVHGLHHDQNPFRSESIFKKQAIEINRYLKEWNSVGFRNPSMYHDLELLHHLNVEYDASTFDTDPFEPQPDGVGTIFPFWVPDNNLTNRHTNLPNCHTSESRYPEPELHKETGFRVKPGMTTEGNYDPGMTNEENQDVQYRGKGYVELPYTLPQDFLLFILMQEKNTDIWKMKLDWIVDHGGMVLFNTHPNYMNFNTASHYQEYPARFYEEFLTYIKDRYKNQYWHALPRDMAKFFKVQCRKNSLMRTLKKNKKRACMLYYMKFKGSAILYREAKALQDKGFEVDIICLRESKDEKVIQSFDGLNLFFIQSRPTSEQKAALYFLRLLIFCLKSFFVISYLGLQKRYDIVHVTSPPDIIVFSALVPKLLGAGIILDIHDIGPELYMRKLNVTENKPVIRLLKYLESVSARFADHVITVTDIWKAKLLKRVNHGIKCSVLLNVPDEDMFKPFSARKPLPKNGCNLFYHGSFEEHFGVDTLIKAMPIVKKQIPQVKLNLYGGGRLYKTMMNLSKELDLDDCVHFNGAVPFFELPEILKRADIGIVPTKASVFSDEALSMKSLEYMTLGIPIVISKTTAHRYYYNDTMVMFFTPEDENDLAKAIISLYQKSGAERDGLIDGAMKFLDEHSWSHAKEDYYNIVQSLICRK